MAEARIFQDIKSSTQSGRRREHQWVLEFTSTRAKRPDPLTGWAGGADTDEQVRLVFPDAAAAKAYAAKQGLVATVVVAPEKVLKLQAYADNFR